VTYNRIRNISSDLNTSTTPPSTATKPSAQGHQPFSLMEIKYETFIELKALQRRQGIPRRVGGARPERWTSISSDGNDL